LPAIDICARARRWAEKVPVTKTGQAVELPTFGGRHAMPRPSWVNAGGGRGGSCAPDRRRRSASSSCWARR
jgi:hypothetical protein